MRRVGRNLAPHLKSLIGCWYLSQYDTYAPVATMASVAFQASFPAAEKRRDAINYCSAEITNVKKLTVLSFNFILKFKNDAQFFLDFMRFNIIS